MNSYNQLLYVFCYSATYIWIIEIIVINKYNSFVQFVFIPSFITSVVDIATT